MYAEILLNGWLQMLEEKDSNCPIELLSLSRPKRAYNNCPEPLKNVHIHDLYSIDWNELPSDTTILKRLLSFLEPSKANAVLILDCLSSLVFHIGLSQACQFISKLGQSCRQLICINRRDFTLKKIPSIETLGTSYIKLKKSPRVQLERNFMYEASIIHRKPGGSIVHQNELVNQNISSYVISSEKLEVNQKGEPVNNEPVKVLASFRIEMNAREMEQRNKTPLPYTISTNESKILYSPDDVDDLDEEDPDDDLDF
ncbi:elongator complex protein 5 isoform X2 [Cephus cinctus]|nr:elongator complex protein 5 isoform X2 [Cephus cinctus]